MSDRWFLPWLVTPAHRGGLRQRYAWARPTHEIGVPCRVFLGKLQQPKAESRVEPLQRWYSRGPTSWGRVQNDVVDVLRQQGQPPTEQLRAETATSPSLRDREQTYDECIIEVRIMIFHATDHVPTAPIAEFQEGRCRTGTVQYEERADSLRQVPGDRPA